MTLGLGGGGWAEGAVGEGKAACTSPGVREKASSAVTHALNHQLGCSEATSLPRVCVHAHVHVCLANSPSQAAPCAHFPPVNTEVPPTLRPV